MLIMFFIERGALIEKYFYLIELTDYIVLNVTKKSRCIPNTINKDNKVRYRNNKTIIYTAQIVV